MTIPFDTLLRLVEKAPTNARGIFAEWVSIDPELKASYAYDMQWLLINVQETLREPELSPLNRERLCAALSVLAELAGECALHFGLDRSWFSPMSFA